MNRESAYTAAVVLKAHADAIVATCDELLRLLAAPSAPATETIEYKDDCNPPTPHG